MIYKTFLFSKSLMKSDVKRFWWISSLYALTLFFILPFNHLVVGPPGPEKYSREMFKRSLDLSSGQNDFQIMLICVVPVLAAVLLFKYLQTPRSAAMMHSLPYSRWTLFLNHSAAGLFLLMVPVVVNGLVLIILQLTTFLHEYYSLGDILRWMGYTMLFNILFYAIGIFVGMFTGSSIAQIVFTYILHVLPEGFNVLLHYNLGQLLYGYADTNDHGTFLNDLPLFLLLNHRVKPDYFTAGHITVYLVFTVLFFVSAYYVYKMRKLESAGELVAFPYIRPVFKYGVTVCGMLLGGAYFAGISGGSYSIIVFGYLFSSFLGYWIAEVLMKKSFRVWDAYKGYMGFTALLILLLVSIKTDFIGYQSRVPEIDQVQKVYLGNDFGKWERTELGKGKEDRKEREFGPQIVEYYTADNGGCFLESQENIANTIQLHRHLVQERPRIEGISRYIIYTLKNGKHLIRQYPIDNKRLSGYLTPIYESLEYKGARFPVLTQDPERIKLIEIKDDRTPKRPVILSDSKEIKEFLKIFREELSTASFQELTLRRNIPTSIRITDDEEGIQHYEMPKEYELLFSWLKAKGYYEKVMLLPQEVEFVELEIQDRKYSEKSGTRQTPPPRVKITDPEVIKELVEVCADYEYSPEKEQIGAIFYTNGDGGRYDFYGYLNKEAPVSESLESYLKQL